MKRRIPQGPSGSLGIVSSDDARFTQFSLTFRTTGSPLVTLDLNILSSLPFNDIMTAAVAQAQVAQHNYAHHHPTALQLQVHTLYRQSTVTCGHLTTKNGSPAGYRGGHLH